MYYLALLGAVLTFMFVVAWLDPSQRRAAAAGAAHER